MQAIRATCVKRSALALCALALAVTAGIQAPTLSRVLSRARARAVASAEVRPLAAPPGTPPVPGAGAVRAEGRLTTYPGGEVVLGTELGGILARVLVAEKSVVKKGDVVAELQGSEQQAALKLARAQTRCADVDSWFWGQEDKRAHSLLKTEAISQADAERATHERSAAWARRQAAVAAQQRMTTLLSKLRVVAPLDGTVIVRHVNVGETVQPGAPVVTMADLSRLRIEAEVDEFDTGRVRLGADVVITAEGYPRASWRGRVEDIPDVVLPRRTKPQDPRRASDLRVLLVKIALSEPTPLKLGQRVEVEVRGPDVREDATNDAARGAR